MRYIQRFRLLRSVLIVMLLAFALMPLLSIPVSAEHGGGSGAQSAGGGGGGGGRTKPFRREGDEGHEDHTRNSGSGASSAATASTSGKPI